MLNQTTPRWVRAFALGVAMLAFGGWAAADPPSRVARLGYIAGAVSFSPAGEADWVQARVNRPLGSGDRLWSDARGRAEIQVGGAMLRMSAGTGLSVLNLDDRIAQFQLTQGTLIVRVRRLDPDQAFEVDTPNLAFVLRQAGEYRIEVDPDRDETTVVVHRGQGEAYGDDASYLVDARQPYRFSGTDLREYEPVDAPRPDEFDRWAGERDHAFDNSASSRYVSPDVVGYQDLDANGTWRRDADYGNVWVPNRVPAGWAPYRDGHWAWIDPWGWTWVDDAPWGYAVSHYGRWAHIGGTWGWVPGPVSSPAYYAPALVVFVGGANFQLTISSGAVGGVAWFPLAPREVFRPSYAVSRGYFENVNRSNTVINNTVINNVYNNVNVTQVVYANRQVAGAVVAVPTTAFVQSQPISRAAVQVSREMIVSRPVAVAPPVAPTLQSVHGAAVRGDAPPPRVFARPVVARTAPAAAHVGLAVQQQQLAARPGTPLGETERKALRPVAAVPTPVVKVLAPTAVAARAIASAPASVGSRPADAASRPDARAAPALPAAASAAETPRANAAPPKPVAAPAAGLPGPSSTSADRRPIPEARVPAEARPPQVVAAPEPAAPAQAAAPASTPARADRGKPEPRAAADPRDRLGAAPPRTLPSPVVQAPAIASAPAAQPPAVAPAAPIPPRADRGKPEPRAAAAERERPGAPPPRTLPSPVVQAPAIAPAPAPAAQPPAVAPAAPMPPRADRGKPEPRAAAAERERPVAPLRTAPPPIAQAPAPDAGVEPAPAPKAGPRAREPAPAASRPHGDGRDPEQRKPEAERKAKD